MKKLWNLFALLLCAALLCSCSPEPNTLPDNISPDTTEKTPEPEPDYNYLKNMSRKMQLAMAIEVTSQDYPMLTTMEVGAFDPDRVRDWYVAEDNPYKQYSCSVSVEDGKLEISNKRNDNTGVYLQQFNNGYFMGVDLGEFDGWVRYFPYYSNLYDLHPDIIGEPVVVVQQPCFGFIQQDLDHGYVLTRGLNADENVYYGMIYELNGYRGKGGSWTWSEYASFEGVPQSFLYNQEDNSIYVATTAGIYLITDGGHVQTIVDSAVSGAIRANSMVLLDGSIYCGSSAGVYRYDMEKNLEAWYPMEYQSIVNQAKEP